jgi:hypothetical protein
VARTRRGRRTRGFWAPNGQEQWSKRTVVKQYNRYNPKDSWSEKMVKNIHGQPITSSNNNNGQTNNIVQ